MSERGRRDPLDNAAEAKSGTSVSEKIKAEVERLSKKGPLSRGDVVELYKKYANDESIAEEIMSQLNKRMKRAKKQAKETAQKIYKKYNNGNRPLHEILEKMMKYKTEYKWSDAEFDEFRKELTSLLSGQRAMEVDLNQNLVSMRSRINRALGNSNIKLIAEEGQGLNISIYS